MKKQKKQIWDKVEIIAKNNPATNLFLLSIYIDEDLIYSDWINEARAKDVLPLIAKIKNFKPKTK